MPSSLRRFVLGLGIAAVAAGGVQVSASQQRPADARDAVVPRPGHRGARGRRRPRQAGAARPRPEGRRLRDRRGSASRRTIGSFTLVSRGTGLGIGVRVKKEDPTTVVTPDGDVGADEADDRGSRRPSWRSCSTRSRRKPSRLCQRAALYNIKMVGETKARMAVFSTEPFVRVVQRYTTDPALLLRLGVERLTPTGTEVKDMTNAKLDDVRQRLQQLDARRPEPDPGVLARGRRRRRRRRRAERRHDRAGGGRPAPRPGRDADAAGVRLARPRPPRIQHDQLDHRGARVDGPHARPEERRVLLGRPARLPGAADAAAVAGRNRQPLEHHRSTRSTPTACASLSSTAETRKEVEALGERTAAADRVRPRLHRGSADPRHGAHRGPAPLQQRGRAAAHCRRHRRLPDHGHQRHRHRPSGASTRTCGSTTS